MNELISIFCEQLTERWKIPVLPPSVQLQFFISGFFQRHTLFTSHYLLNISKVFLTWHINSSNCNGRKALHALNPVMDRNWVAGSDQVWLASLLTFYFSVCLTVLLDKLFLRPNCPHACSGGFSYIEGFSHIF